jgi:hypothetical protein
MLGAAGIGLNGLAKADLAAKMLLRGSRMADASAKMPSEGGSKGVSIRACLETVGARTSWAVRPLPVDFRKPLRTGMVALRQSAPAFPGSHAPPALPLGKGQQ